MPHILVVDDDPVASKLLQYVLAAEEYAVTTLDRPPEVLVALATTAYDLVLLDVMLPDMDGLELCRHIRLSSTIPIILISARGDVPTKVAGLRLGADDYMGKPLAPEEVLARVAAVLRRSQPDHLAGSKGQRVRTEDVVLDASEGTAVLVRETKTVHLTPTEIRLLSCLLKNPGQPVTREALCAKVWDGYDESRSKELDVYIKRLRGKLEHDPYQPQLLRSVRGVGYKYQPTDLPEAPRLRR